MPMDSSADTAELRKEFLRHSKTYTETAFAGRAAQAMRRMREINNELASRRVPVEPLPRVRG